MAHHPTRYSCRAFDGYGDEYPWAEYGVGHLGRLPPQSLSICLTEEQAIEDLSAPIRPSIYTMKRGKYLLFILLMVLTHVGTLLLLEAFSSTLFLQMVPHILGSTLITCVVFAIFEAFSKRNHPA